MRLAGQVAVADAGTWLQQWRTAQGKKQDWCAERVGVSRSRYAEIEAGAAPSFDVAVKLQKLTGIAPADFHKRTKRRQVAGRRRAGGKRK